MKKNLSISLVQSNIIWEDKKANLIKYDELLCPGSDLYILPEMFNTGFSMSPKPLSETMDGTSITWLKEKAAELNGAICTSLIIEDKGYRNRMVFVSPDGQIEYYDKRHLFSMAGENDFFVAGKERKIITYKGWNIFLQVCYDLRFPVYSRNIFKGGKWDYDLAIYVANWPSPRSNAWRNLIEARAIENQCYVAAVNRIGEDGNDLNYLGDSALIDPKGKHLLSFEQEKEAFKTSKISFESMNIFRQKFPLGLDADRFNLL